MRDKSLSFPSVYLITGEQDTKFGSFLDNIERCLESGIRLVQLRAKELSLKEYISIAKDVNQLCQQYQANLILNHRLNIVAHVPDVKGIHLASKALMQCDAIPNEIKDNYVVSAPCHNLNELKKAEKLRLDFGVLTPVLQTGTHPDAPYLGWNKALSLRDKTTLPLYVAGGLSPNDVTYTEKNGFLGIAAIGSIWGSDPIRGRIF